MGLVGTAKEGSLMSSHFAAPVYKLIVDAFPVVDLPHTLKVLRKTEIYEDNMVAKVLYSADVEPREQDYGAVWTPEP